MYPVLFEIGPVTIYSFGFFLALAYVLATFIFWREGKKQGYQEEKLIDFSVISLLAAIIGGRLLYSLINYKFFLSQPSQILAFWEGGFAYYGSFFAVFFVGAYLVRKWRWSFFQIADVGSLAALAAIVLGKVGSFFSGNDYGTLTNLPWGVTFSFLEGRRHPVQLYEAFFSLILFVCLYIFYKKNLSRPLQLRSGAVFFYFLLFSSGGRFIFELFRSDSTMLGPFRLASFVSLIIAAVALFSIYYYQFRNFRNDFKAVSKYFLGVSFRIRNPLKKRY